MRGATAESQWPSLARSGISGGNDRGCVLTGHGPARARRLLARATELAESDPHAALAEIHRLLDGGGASADAYALEARLLITLGCGSFAAHAAECGLAAGGDPLAFLLLQLEAHLVAFNRGPARHVLDRLLEMEPLPALAADKVAHAASELGRHADAERLYETRLTDAPADHRVHVNFAHALLKTGKIGRAEALLEKAVTLSPGAGHGWRLLVGARRQTDHARTDAIRAALSHAGNETGETAALHYALGKTLEDLSDHPGAFRAFADGAAAMRPRIPYSTRAVADAFAITRRYFGGREAAPAAKAESAPLFIVGLPRTGSTLVDRMLTGHPKMVSQGELGCFKEAMKVLTGYAGGAGFHEHFYGAAGRQIDLTALGALYRRAAAPDGTAPRWFIDKYHMNFLDIGLIADAIPEARFIHTTRHPLDTVFGNFKQLFTLGFHHFSYDLVECAEYYLLYREQMAFWHARLPGRILDVAYEDVVADQRGQAQRMLDFLGLEWNDAVVRHEKNPAPVDTASLVQVREPLYVRAVGHWRHYAAELEPAAAVLRAGGVEVEA